MTLLKEPELTSVTAAPAGGGTAAPGEAFTPRHPESRKITVIEPSHGWIHLNIGEVWEYRDLLFTLAQRDVKLRYRQTALGAAWVAFQPLLATAIFTIIFGILGRNSFTTGGLPPFLFIFAGQMSWQLFFTTVSRANSSLISNAHLVSKVYFPRLVLPISTILSNLIDFGVSLVVLFGLMLLLHVALPTAFFLMPVFALLTALMAIGIGLFAAALTVSYRDVAFVVPVFLNMLMYASPVNYDTPTKLHGLVKLFYAVNPLTGLVQGMRWTLVGTQAPSLPMVAYTTVFSITVFLIGAFAFRRMERRFADVI